MKNWFWRCIYFLVKAEYDGEKIEKRDFVLTKWFILRKLNHKEIEQDFLKCLNEATFNSMKEKPKKNRFI